MAKFPDLKSSLREACQEVNGNLQHEETQKPSLEKEELTCHTGRGSMKIASTGYIPHKAQETYVVEVTEKGVVATDQKVEEIRTETHKDIKNHNTRIVAETENGSLAIWT